MPFACLPDRNPGNKTMKRIYTSKNKAKVLARAIKDKQKQISLWQSPDGVWHAALGPTCVPDWAIAIEHIK